MKNVLKPLAVAVSAAVTIATVPAIASDAPAEAAPAPVSHAQIQQMGQQFRFGSLSQDANTLSVEKGTVRLADNNRGLELVGDNGSVLMTLPLLASMHPSKPSILSTRMPRRTASPSPSSVRQTPRTVR